MPFKYSNIVIYLQCQCSEHILKTTFIYYYYSDNFIFCPTYDALYTNNVRCKGITATQTHRIARQVNILFA